MVPAIDIHDVRKTYQRRIHALRGVSLHVEAGEVFGLLGPNGAGKSTLVKILLTIVRPDAAAGTLLGERLGHRATLARVGYLPENARFPPHLNGAQVLDFYAALAKVPRAVRRRRAAALLEQVGLQAWRTMAVVRYSKGMLQRLGIAQALMNDPQLVFLDEPTDGLDPLGRRDVRHMLTELRRAGRTVFINSHILSELEMICDRVSILVEGRTAREGTLAELTRHTMTYRVTVRGDLAPLRDDVLRAGASIDGDALVLSDHDAARLNTLIDLLRGRGVLIEAIEPKRLTLEDVFIQTVEGSPVGG